MDSDGNGEGDVVGITNRLEHLKELGATGFWLNPIFLSPFKGEVVHFIRISSVMIKLKPFNRWRIRHSRLLPNTSTLWNDGTN
jgi:glycosidase